MFTINNSIFVGVAIVALMTMGVFFSVSAITTLAYPNRLGSEAETRENRRHAYAFLVSGILLLVISLTLVYSIPDPVNKQHVSIADQASSPRG